MQVLRLILQPFAEIMVNSVVIWWECDKRYSDIFVLPSLWRRGALVIKKCYVQTCGGLLDVLVTVAAGVVLTRLKIE